MRLTLFAYGNPSRGDDALAPELLRLFEQSDYHHPEKIILLTDFQLQIEHALDLEQTDIALFIDASVACKNQFCFNELIAEHDVTYTSHALHPKAILYVYEQITHREPPPSFLLTIRGYQFELGEPLSDEASANLAAAFTFLTQWIQSVIHE